MQINFNGKQTEIAENISITDLIANYALDINAIAIEHNLKIIAPEQYEQVKLQDGDSLEVVEFVGGG